MPEERRNTFSLMGRIAGQAHRLVAGISVPIIVYRPDNLPARAGRNGRPMEFDFFYVFLLPGSLDQQTAALLWTKQAKGRVIAVEGYMQQRDLDQPVWNALRQALPVPTYEAVHAAVASKHAGLVALLTRSNIRRTVIDLVAIRFSMPPEHPACARLAPVEVDAVASGGGNYESLVEVIADTEPLEEAE